MLATATHDHKRGEDVRARLAVLSEIADEWSKALERWLTLSAEQFPWQAQASRCWMRRTVAMLFQTIVGAWPHGSLRSPTRTASIGFAKRIAAWQQKALREAKLRSEWTAPNESL